MIRSSRLLLVLLVGAFALFVGIGPATAQESSTTSTSLKVPTRAAVEFEIGDYDSAVGDWAIEAVTVTGDIQDNTTFTIILRGSGGRELWRVDSEFMGPEMRIPVGAEVAVGDVTSTELSSNLVAGQLITPELEDRLQGGGGSTGQVATSMALVMIIAVILFRTPLPAAATQRWTK
jgi:hypothetical protein